MSDTKTNTNIFENTRDADSKIEHLLGSKIRVKTDDISTIEKIRREGQQSVRSNRPQNIISGNLGENSSQEDYKSKYETYFSDKIRSGGSGTEEEKKSLIHKFAISDYSINKLERGTIFDNNVVIQNIESTIEDFKSILASAKDVENLNISKLKALVRSFIEQTGPNQNASLLLVNLVNSPEEDYFYTHSINVCIFSLIIAIEVSKLMLHKVTSPEIHKDYNKTRLCGQKTFTENELVDLGVAAFIHDIYLKKKFSSLSVNMNMTFRDQLEYKRHSIESFRIAEKFGLNRDIQLAIMQHHECLDGKGYPDGIHENVFNRYAKIISLADRYESLAFLNPFTPVFGPIGAINHILKKEKSSFDADLLISFLKATSLFPLGSFVLLNTGEIAVVFEISNESLQKPKVKILFSKNKVELKEAISIDLNDYPDIKVERAVHPREVKSVLATVRAQLKLR